MAKLPGLPAIISVQATNAIQLCPAPWTDAAVMEATAALMRRARMVPAVLRREVAGFVLNRLQIALVSEAFRLVADGVISAEDVDATVKLPEDSTAKIASESLLGGNFVSLEPGGSDTMIESGGEIAFTQDPVDIFGLVSQFVLGNNKSSGSGSSETAEEPAAEEPAAEEQAPVEEQPAANQPEQGTTTQ